MVFQIFQCIQLVLFVDTCNFWLKTKPILEICFHHYTKQNIWKYKISNTPHHFHSESFLQEEWKIGFRYLNSSAIHLFARIMPPDRSLTRFFFTFRHPPSCADNISHICCKCKIRDDHTIMTRRIICVCYTTSYTHQKWPTTRERERQSREPLGMMKNLMWALRADF